jgi:hypothetical protein
MAKNDKSTPDVAAASTGAEEILNTADFDSAILKEIQGWAEEQIGFPPYWTPGQIGRKFLATPVALDTRDENFHRFILKVTRAPIECQTGPSADAKKQVVKPGEMFTMSPYAALPLERYFDIEVYVEVVGQRQLPATEESKGRPRDLWEWRLLVSPESQKLLNARREDEQRKLMAERQVSYLPVSAGA